MFISFICAIVCRKSCFDLNGNKILLFHLRSKRPAILAKLTINLKNKCLTRSLIQTVLACPNTSFRVEDALRIIRCTVYFERPK